MIFVDTSYLWAILDEGDILHARASAWEMTVSEPLITTEYVLWELVNAFSQPAHRLKVHPAFDLIQASPQWHIVAANQLLFDEGILKHRSHRDKEWSLTDCISFNVMRERAITRALTHDHHFEQAGFEALLRRDPP